MVKVLRSSLLNGHRTIVDSNSRHLQTSQMLTLPLNFELSSAFENVETPFSSPPGPNLRSMVLANASPTNDKETNILMMVQFFHILILYHLFEQPSIRNATQISIFLSSLT